MLLRQRYPALLGGHNVIKITSLSIAGALLAFGISAAPAAAPPPLPNRTFVSGHGSDSGVCTRGAPCKTFARAITETTAGGEIDVVDSGEYGAVTITKSISIVNDGAGVAGITASSGDAITINAGGSDNVHLRGLTINGSGSGSNGIQFNTGGNLAIENCVIRNFANAGINIVPNASSTFSVSNTIASNNPGNGIDIAPTPAAVTGVLNKVTANNNGFNGIIVNGTATTGGSINVTIVDSEASNNSAFGVFSFRSSAGAATTVMVRNVVSSYNGTGLFAEGAAILRAAHSVVTGNTTGVNTSGGGILYSYGDNDINGNTTDVSGTLTPVATR
jgi:hypothetical protein